MVKCESNLYDTFHSECGHFVMNGVELLMHAARIKQATGAVNSVHYSGSMRKSNMCAIDAKPEMLTKDISIRLGKRRQYINAIK